MPTRQVDAGPILRQLEQRWLEMLRSLAAGRDVEPARLLRCEGFMEAVVALELASAEDLDAAFVRLRAQTLDEQLPEQDMDQVPWSDWRALHPFPALCLHQQRAPVRTTGAPPVESYEPD